MAPTHSTISLSNPLLSTKPSQSTLKGLTDTQDLKRPALLPQSAAGVQSSALRLTQSPALLGGHCGRSSRNPLSQPKDALQSHATPQQLRPTHATPGVLTKSQGHMAPVMSVALPEKYRSHATSGLGNRTAIGKSRLQSSNVTLSKREPLSLGTTTKEAAPQDGLVEAMFAQNLLHELVVAADECSWPEDVLRLPRPRPLAPAEHDVVAVPDDDGIDLINRKLHLTNAVAASLISSPDFTSETDVTKLTLLDRVLAVVDEDPEFLLKLALYTRCELNIRVTANWMLAVASLHPEARRFLRAYFGKSIRLPSDWIEVAQLVQVAGFGEVTKPGSLPAALRKAMVSRFAGFDEYQLGKYNKAASATDKASGKICFTLKQLIRKLHIVSPVSHVLGILGKRYPETFQEFTAMRMEGAFDSSRAGTRMKLAVPETWETQVSLHGNKAQTWQDLLEHRKLPFMAMLRNLRNMLLAQMEPKYHRKVLNILQSRRAVLNSRQFPFRFFSAYKVLTDLRAMTPKPGQVLPSEKRVREYRGALDTAVKIATRGNVKPIRGTTLLFCNVSDSMRQKCPTARGIGSSSDRLEAALLLGLMCKYSCERCDFHLFSDRTAPMKNVELVEGTILQNLEKLLAMSAAHSTDWSVLANSSGPASSESPGFPMEILHEVLKTHREVDKIIVLSDDGEPSPELLAFADLYRWQTNPDMLLVHVDLSGARAGVQPEAAGGESAFKSENNVKIAGFSDAILRYIADRGDGADQVSTIETINASYGISQAPQGSGAGAGSAQGSDAATRTFSGASAMSISEPRENDDCTVAQSPSIKVFISSTFRDMHGERDILTRYVFPELRARAAPFGVDVNEIDLRWGVTEKMAQNSETLALCLDEIASADFFVGLLGERYGWVADEYATPQEPRFDWLKSYPGGRSITEIEMHYGALQAEPAVKGRRSLFALRDPTVLNEIPESARGDFACPSQSDREKLALLKERVREAAAAGDGCRVLDDYAASWDKTAPQGKPAVTSLEEFAEFFLEELWVLVVERYGINLDEPSSRLAIAATSPQVEARLHQAYAERAGSTYVGHEALFKSVLDWAGSDLKNQGLRIISGGAGGGKSSFLARAVQLLQRSSIPVVFHFGGTSVANSTPTAMLTTICHGLTRMLRSGASVPTSYFALKSAFVRLLEAVAKRLSVPLIVVVDGLDKMGTASSPCLDWIPVKIPKGCKILVAAGSSKVLRQLREHAEHDELKLPPMRPTHAREVIRQTLARFTKVLDESNDNDQLEMLVTKRDASSPVYLGVACEEIRVFSVFEQLTSFIQKLPETLESLYVHVLGRLERDLGHGVVEGSAQLVVLSRAGLSPVELRRQLKFVLGMDIPPMPFARLWRSLAPFLSVTDEAEGTMSITNGTLLAVVKERYQLSGTVLMKLHRLLAKYHGAAADPAGDGSFRARHRASLLALPFHMVQGSLSNELASTLSNLAYVQAKCAVGLAENLLTDYQPAAGLSRAHAATLDRVLSQPKVVEMKEFAARNLRVVGPNSALTLQQAIHEPTDTQPRRQAESKLAGLSSELTVFNWASRPTALTHFDAAIEDGVADLSAVAYNPNGRSVALGDKDGTIRIYELATTRLVATLSGHSAAVSCLSYCGASTLCSAGWDLAVVVWDLAKGAERSRQRGFNRRVNGLAANREGTQVVAASWDATARCFQVSDGATVAEHVDPEGVPINAVAWLPYGGLVLLGNWTGKVTCWDPSGTFAVFTIDAHAESIRSVSASGEGRLLTASISGEVKLWTPMGRAKAAEDPELEVTPAPETFTNIGTYDAGAQSIESALFCNGGQRIVLAAGDGLQLLDSKIGVPAGAPFGRDHRHNGHSAGPITAVSEVRGGFVAVGHRSGAVRICSTESDGAVCVATGHTEAEVSAVALAAKRHDLAVGTVAEGAIWLYVKTTMGGGGVAWELACRFVGGHDSASVHSLAFNPAVTTARSEAPWLASGGSDGSVSLWSLPTKTPIHPEPVDVGPLLALEGHDNAVTGLAFLKGAAVRASLKAAVTADGGGGGKRGGGGGSSDADHVVSTGRDGTVRVWNTQTGELVSSVLTSSDWINDVAVSPDKKLIALVSNDCSVTVRSSVGDGPATRLGTHGAAATSVTFLSNTLVASTGLDDKVRVWSLELDLELTAVETAAAVAVTPSPSGGFFAVGADGVQEVGLQFGACIATLDGHRGPIAGVAVGPGDSVASCGRFDRTVLGWKTRSATKPDTRHACAVSAVAAAELGDRVRFCSGDVEGGLCAWSSSGSTNTSASVDSRGSFALTRRVDRAHDGVISGVAIGHNGSVYSSGVDGRVCRWDANLRLIEEAGDAKCTPISALAVSNDGLVAVGRWDGVVRLLTPDLQGVVQTVHRTEWIEGADMGAVVPNSCWVSSLSFHVDLDGDHVLTATCLDGTVHTRRRSAGGGTFEADGVRKAPLRLDSAGAAPASHRTKMVSAVAWSCPGSTAVVMADTAGCCRVLTENKEGAGGAGFVAHRESVTAVARHSRGVATASVDGRVKVWDVDVTSVANGRTRQRGEFTCRSSVTALSPVEGTDCTLFCGDQLGYVYLLQPLGDAEHSAV